MMCHSLSKFYYNSKYPIFTLNNLNFEEDVLNNYCFDCGRRDPEFISINNGIFICRKCGMDHMLFPGGSSILVENDINSLSEKEKEYIKNGGNKKLYEFIYNQCPSLMNLPKQYLYTSPILNSYQSQLLQNVNKNEAKRKKMNNFQISPNYSSKEINCSLKRHNHNTDLFYSGSLNDEKNIFKNKIKCKFSDDYYNKFNQKTNNTHANTISNSNTLTYVSERTNENLYNLINIDNKKTIEQKSKIILTNPSIVYNKPKISNSFNIKKLDKDKEKKNINNKNYNNSSTINNNNNYYSNNTIDYDKLTRDSLNIFKTPQKKNNSRFFFNNSKIKFNHNNNNSKEKRNKSERKIKEIIINKKMNKLNIDNSESNSNKLWYKTKTFFQKRKPKEENNNNTINYSESNNISNKDKADLNFNESIINNNNIKTIEINNRYKCRYINVNKNNFDNFNSENNVRNNNNNNNYIIDSNNIEININNNLKKEKQIIININNNNNYNKNENECEKFKNKCKENLNANEDLDEKRAFSHKRNRLSSNFFINKNKLEIKEMKKLYFKNKRNNYKENRLDENKSKEKEKKFNNTYISKDNVEHFQIFSNNNTNFSKKENNDYNEKEKNRFRITLLRRNILNKNKFAINNSCLFLNDLEEMKSGETSKYSIRNKYKKERSLQKIKDI